MSHSDTPDHGALLERLRVRSQALTRGALNTITAGDAPIESARVRIDGVDIDVAKLPDDPDGVLRVSIGGHNEPGGIGVYCRFRGNKSDAVDALKKCLRAIDPSQEEAK